MRFIFNCLLVQFVSMDISAGNDNISSYKPTKQSSDTYIIDVSENAVDGSISTCSSTDASNPAWWYVDLQEVKSIYDVEIYFRLYESRFGCDRDGVYESNCNETCPTNCQERRCYVSNGTCVDCTDGWTGEKCPNACPAGKYGAECKKRCTDHCGNNTSCNHVTGQCEGCLSGWMGYDSNEMCPSGTYGKGCEQNCSGNCFNNDTCYHVDGNCPRGCRVGFQGNRCDEQSIVVDMKSLCSDQIDNVAGLTTGLVISLLINVGFCSLLVLYFIRKKDVSHCRKKENKKENDQPSYEVSDRGSSHQSSTSGGHLENHTYEDLSATRTTDAPQVYRNLSLIDTRTNSL